MTHAIGALFTIDRFEGEYAVCEDSNGKMHDFARVELPRDAREGDVLRRAADGALFVDQPETANRRALARRLFEQLLGE